MPKKQFRNLKDLEKYVQEKVQIAMYSNTVEAVFKGAMQEKVYSEVYDAYTPLEYERRQDEDGLSDKDNMVFTTKGVKEGKRTLVSLFENVTLGNERQDNVPYEMPISDSMSGHFISSLIENGSTTQHTTNANAENGWYKTTNIRGENGKWTIPRPFARATAEELRNPLSYYNRILASVLEHEINR